MTLNSIKNRVDKLTNSKQKGIHVFTINEESDSLEKKTEIYQQIEELKKRGEDPLLILVRTLREAEDLKEQ